ACAADGDDSDIKIAGDTSQTTQHSTSEELERLAALVKTEHDNGNIERAKRLAVTLVDTVFTHDVFTDGVKDEELLVQIRLLITFTLDICLENGLPNQIVAQSAQNLFYEQISLRDHAFYDKLQTSGAFSMYLLCTRSESANSASIGDEFAKLCRREGDEGYTKLGRDVFEYYLKLCADKIRSTQFVKQ
ncbi:MAG: hypothetical protein ACERKO_03650, partial [Acetanaerobacterium sp.]